MINGNIHGLYIPMVLLNNMLYFPSLKAVILRNQSYSMVAGYVGRLNVVLGKEIQHIRRQL